MSEATQSPTKSPGSRPSTATSRSLLWRARDKDPAAWERMVSLYAPLVAYWCRRTGLQEEDAADIFQEVFQSVAANLHAFRKEKPSDTFRGWLRIITQNKIRDRFRKAGNEPHAAGGTEAHRWLEQVASVEPEAALASDSSDSQSSDSDGSDDAEAERVLFRRALALIQSDFAEHTWRAFWRTAVDGQTSGDVADELGMTPGAVRVAKSRVLQRLREELGDLL